MLKVPVAYLGRDPREPGPRPAPAHYILYASHIAAVGRHRPSLGAATPVQIGGGGNDDRTERSRTPSDDRNDDDPLGSPASRAAGRAVPNGGRKAVEDAVPYIRGSRGLTS